MFRITAFARLGGVSAKVLRDYDEHGVFRPAWTDPSSSYRLYSAAQLPDLRRVIALRDLGVSLAEIRAHVADGEGLRLILERRRSALEQARNEIERRLAGLGISLGAGDAAADVVLRDIPAELAATLDVAAGGDVGRAFYELERAVRDARVRATRPPGALVASGPGSARPAIEIFVPLRRAAAGLTVRRLPAIRAATILHRGPYAAMSATRGLLDDWIAVAGLVPTEPVRILYLQFGAESELEVPHQYLVERAADLLTEIQVPLSD